MRKTFFHNLIAVVLLFSGCATAPQGAVAQAPVPNYPTCQPGQHVPNQQGLFHVSFFAVMQGPEMHRFVTGGKIVGDYAQALFEATRRGEVEHLQGSGNITVRIHNVDRMPPQVMYLGGKMICRGMAPLTQVQPGIWEAQIPIEGGQWLGYVSLVVPTTALVTRKHNAWVCVKTSFNMPYVPELTSGMYRREGNTLCGLPGQEPGSTRLGLGVATGARFSLMPLIVERSN